MLFQDSHQVLLESPDPDMLHQLEQSVASGGGSFYYADRRAGTPLVVTMVEGRLIG
jgi:hypothetical protein